MKHYHGYWPVLAIIKQYLSNIKKRLAQDLKAERDDPALPGSKEPRNIAPKVKEDSSHIRNAKEPANKKTKKHPLNGSGKALQGAEEELEDVEYEAEESEDEESDEDEVDLDDEDEIDLEDDKAEMEMYEHYSKQVDEDERHKRKDGERIPPVETSVEYQLFLIYLSLTSTLFYCE
jgi:hypothetical protein